MHNVKNSGPNEVQGAYTYFVMLSTSSTPQSHVVEGDKLQRRGGCRCFIVPRRCTAAILRWD